MPHKTYNVSEMTGIEIAGILNQLASKAVTDEGTLHYNKMRREYVNKTLSMLESYLLEIKPLFDAESPEGQKTAEMLWKVQEILYS